MTDRKTSLRCRFAALFSGLALNLLTIANPAFAAEFKPLSSQQSPIKLVGWPDTLDFSHRDGGYTSNYALRRYRATARNFYNDTRTTIFVTEVQPGYIWRGAGGRDVREMRAFKKPTGWFSFLKGATFPPGQLFECDNDAKCQFRAIDFMLGARRCQWVGFNPAFGTLNNFWSPHSSDFRVSLQMIHCGNSKSFSRDNIRIDHNANTITITYPDPKGAVAPQTQAERDLTDTEVCVDALDGLRTKWARRGFPRQVEIAEMRGFSVADCRRILGEK